MTVRVSARRKIKRVHASHELLGLLALATALLSGTSASAQQAPKSQPDTASRIEQVRADLQAGRIASALKASSSLSTQNKNDVQVHFTLGGLLLAGKQFNPAQLELEKANALQPDKFEILETLGEAYLRTAAYDKAELVLNRALKLKPDSPDALYLLAQAYSAQKKPVDALDLLVRAHKLAPDNADIIFLLARVSMMQNYFEDAIPLLESGLQIAPQRPDLRAALGESYFMAGKPEKAIAEFQALLSARALEALPQRMDRP